MVRLFSIALATVFSMGAFGANLVNFGPEYDVFVQAGAGKDAAGLEVEWEKFEVRHQDIYDKVIYDKTKPGWEKRLRDKRDAFFAEYTGLTPKMDDLFAQASVIT